MSAAAALGRLPDRALRRLLFAPRERTVAIADLRCTDLPFARRQGFGGEPIERFPVYGFFLLYLEDEGAAREAFRGWYREWFVEREGWRCPKREGGMAGGSLQRAIEEVHRRRFGRPPASPAEADAAAVAEAITARVDHYFALLESIRDHGYEPGRGPSIVALQRGGVHELRNGHHRCAALAALGRSSVPLCVVNLLRFTGRPAARWHPLR